MAYEPNIPQGSDKLSISQTQILENFTQLNSQYGTSGDHYAFNAASNNGKHKKSSYVVQGADPGSSSGEAVLYTKTVSGFSEFFFERDNSGSPIQLSRGNPTGATPGYTFLPGNMLMQWGLVNMGSASETFSFPITYTSGVFVVQATVRSVGSFKASCRTPGLSGVVIDIESAGIGQNVYVLAIGV